MSAPLSRRIVPPDGGFFCAVADALIAQYAGGRFMSVPLSRRMIPPDGGFFVPSPMR